MANLFIEVLCTVLKYREADRLISKQDYASNSGVWAAQTVGTHTHMVEASFFQRKKIIKVYID